MNKPYITPGRLDRYLDLPISFAQTEVRQNKVIPVATLPLNLGETLILQSLTIHLVRILTPGQTPVMRNAAFGMCHVGVYFGTMLTSPVAYARLTSIGSATTNLFNRWRITTPGVYTVAVANNTNNLILSIAATGAAKWIL